MHAAAAFPQAELGADLITKPKKGLSKARDGQREENRRHGAEDGGPRGTLCGYRTVALLGQVNASLGKTTDEAG